MAYGILKCDTITFTNGGVDKSVSISGLVQNPTFSGNVTSTGTISGATITGNAGAFTTITGGVATITSGVFSVGSVTNPSISFSGDANTGIYSPAADTLAFVEGGVEVLRINSSGRVGIGTTSPSRLLTLYDAGTLTYLQLAHSGASGTSRGLELVLNSNEASIINREAGGLFLSTAGGPITFGSAGERARIDASGRLLVGTSTSITTAIQPYLQVQGTGENAYINAGRWSNDTNPPGLIFGKSRGGAVGTLGIVSSGDALGEISFYGDDGSAFKFGARILAEVDGTPGANDMPGRLVFSTTADGASSPTERLRIDSSGRVGIGTGNPAQALSVVGNIVADGSAASQYVASSKAGITSTYLITDANGGNIQTDGAWPIRFTTNSSERARIDSSGRLLVGTSTASGVNSNTAPVLAGNFASFTGSVSANHNTATTLFALENLNATYMVTAVITGTANAGAYHAVYIIGSVAANSHSIQALKAGSLLTLSLSGANVQATQGSGVALTVTWSVTRMANL